MSSVATYSQSDYKGKKSNICKGAERVELSIFDINSDWLADEIYISNIKEEVNNVVWSLGGPAKASKLMNLKYSRLKEWHLGRKPIPLSKLNELLGLIDKNLKQEIITLIDSKQIYLKSRYSYHTIKFPRKITSELAYLIGLLLGDGHLAGDSSNSKGNWNISVFFDHKGHLSIYEHHVMQIFGIKNKIYLPPENYYTSYFASKAVHWFLRSYFDLHNGYKCDKIKIPTRIIDTNNSDLISSCIRGLFDSDGTVIPKKKIVKFASTSEEIADQVLYELSVLGIDSKKSEWLKAKKYKMLFTIGIRGKNNLLRFAEVINFSHPEKRKKLYKLCESL